MVPPVYNVRALSSFLTDASALLLNPNVPKTVSFKESAWNVGIWRGSIARSDEFYVFLEYGGFRIGNQQVSVR